MTDKDYQQIAFWNKEADEVLEYLETSKEGLKDKEAKKRVSIFGKNVISDGKKFPKLRIFLEQFKSPLIFILFGAGIITLLLHDWRDSIFIFATVLVNTSLGFYQENKAENAISHLKRYLKERVRVIRNNKEMEIDTEDVVPGDILSLSLGMRVPADARIIYEKDLMVDEAILTGESLPVKKQKESVNIASSISERSNIIFGGTLIVQGICKAVVYGTGMTSEFGKIAELVSDKKREDTPLQKSVRNLAWDIVKILSVIILGIFVLGILRGDPLIDVFLISVAIAVSAIPEGLPIALTVILAVGVERLAKKNGIVRKLVAAEALGSANVVLTDKTGTLTEAKMNVSNAFTLKDIINGDEKEIESTVSRFSKEKKDILEMALLNVDVIVENEEEDLSEWNLSGRPLEVSLVKDAGRIGIKLNKLKGQVEISNEVIFNSRTKYSVVKIHKGASKILKNIKNDSLIYFGAPEILLSKSKIKKDEYLKALDSINKMAFAGQRVLGVAFADGSKKINPEERKDLKFVGTINFHDPLRKDVKKSVEKVENLGVRVAIVTGDHVGTAMSVAKQLGWKITDANVLSGDQIKELSDEKLSEQLYNIKVFARVSPEQKVRILKLFKDKGNNVAMTGDGVNDSPSLKTADIGVAVGDGADVSKDVADLVLLDNKFNTIVMAIEEGRKIMANIRKAVVYLLSDVLDEVLLIGGSLAFGLALPLNALQILWVNFFSDSFPAIAYAFEDDKSDYSGKPKKATIFNKEVKMLIFGIGVITSVFLFGIYWSLLKLGFDEAIVRTFIFATFGVYTLLVSFSLRSLRDNIWQYNVLENKYLVVGATLGILMMLVAIYIPFFQELFNITVFPVIWWLAVIGFSLFSIALVELIKYFFGKR